MPDADKIHLSGSDIKNITLEVLNGTPSRLAGPEADDLRASIRKTAAEARVAGWVVDVPYDWAD